MLGKRQNPVGLSIHWVLGAGSEGLSFSPFPLFYSFTPISRVKRGDGK